MKALLINPKFPRSFFSYTQALKLSGSKTLNPPLGLITTAALLPKEWDLRVADLETERLSDADWEWADIVMITGMVLQRNGILRLVRRAKESGKISVVGGPYATTLPNELLQVGADFVVRGEAENLMDRLMDALDAKEYGVVEGSAMPDMILSPIPRYDLLRIDDYQNYSVQTSRGCPHNCEFCDVVNLNGSRPRYKNPDQLTDELDSLLRLGAGGQVFIVDDNLIGNKKRAKELLRRLIEWNKANGEPFTYECQASADLGQDLELIDLLTEANFNSAFIGIESTDEDILTNVHKLQNVRHPVIESVKTVTKNGLGVIGSFILGFDGETTGADRRLLAFVEQTNLPVVMLNLLQAGPRTKLGRRLQDEGRLPNLRITGDGTFMKPNFDTIRPMEEILTEHRNSLIQLYEPNRYLERARRYCLTMRPTRKAMAQARGETPPPSYSVPPPLRSQLRDLWSFFRLVWLQGIRPSHRLQFWKGFFSVMRGNPSRFRRYMVYCAVGLDMFKLREIFLTEILTPDDYLEDLGE